MKKWLVIALMGCVVSALHAQEVCGTDLLYKRLVDQNPSLQIQRDSMERAMDQFISAGHAVRRNDKYIIPTVVHVMWSNCEGNISKAQVQDALDILNRGMRLETPDTALVRDDFQDYMGGIDVEFKLATIDPTGNETDGINRRFTQLTLNANDNVKSVANWNSSQRKYFQIWVVENININANGQVNGYAYFPNSVAWSQWGVVIRNDRFGSIGTSNADGSTLPHEVGHNLNLFHTFQDGCGGSCSSSGDRVCDTPPAANPVWSCSSSTNTCTNDAGSGSPYSFGTPDMMENFMSYSTCRYIFTQGQADRMTSRALDLYGHIEDLYSEDNLEATGLSGFRAADFSTANNVVVAHQSMEFSDETRYVADAWEWDFGASSFPPSSDVPNPEVIFIENGLVPVSLTSFFDGDSLEIVKDVFVVTEQGWPVPFEASFENMDKVPSDSLMQQDADLDGNGWKVTSDAAYTGEQSLMIENFGLCGSTSDELISTTLDLEPFNSATVSFRVAFARTDIANADYLRLWMSRDYGATWDLVWVRAGGSLASVSNVQPSSWAPSGEDEWSEYSVNVSNSFKREGVMLKFEFAGDGGNNVYLDDIAIDGTYKNKVFLSAPANGKLGLSEDVLIDWKAVGDVDFYEYEIDVESTFDTPELIAGTNDYIDSSPLNEDTEFLAEGLTNDTKYYWRVRASVGGVYTEWSDVWNFRVSQTGVGQTEINAPSARIFPNPATDQLFIRANKAIAHVKLMDVSGRTVSSTTDARGATEIRLATEAFGSGTYFVIIELQDGSFTTRRLIIQ